MGLLGGPCGLNLRTSLGQRWGGIGLALWGRQHLRGEETRRQALKLTRKGFLDGREEHEICVI